MKYTINPCEACWKSYKNGDCGLNELNSCVVDVATAFTNAPSNNSMRGTLLETNWKECMENKMRELPTKAGKERNLCNLRLNLAPSWVDTPHYFPSLFHKTGDVSKAHEMCHKECEKDNLTMTCKKKCDRDRDAVSIKRVRFADSCFEKDKGVLEEPCTLENYNNPTCKIDLALPILLILLLIAGITLCKYIRNKHE